jgi:tetratricopeptide (TPR) repeat protein
VLDFFDPYRMNSVSANNNLYAGYLLIFLPLAFSGYSVFKGFLKYLSAATGIFAVFFIVITQSRAAYLGLFFATLILLTVLLLRYRVLFTRKNLLAAGLSLLLLSAGVFAFFSSLDAPRKSYFLSKIPVWQYFRSYEESPDVMRINRQKEKAQLTGIPEFDFAGSYYENASLRVIFWKKSASLIASHPMVGTGAGNWRINVPSVAKPDNPDHTFKNYTYSQPHNEWIGFLAELGIPGFILAGIIFFLPILIVLFRVVVKRQEIHVGSVFYCAFLAGFYLYACFDFPFKRIEHNVLVFSILAFLMHKKVLAGRSVNLGSGLWKWLRFFLVGGLLFTTMVLVRRISGEYYTLLMFRNEGKNNEKVIFYGQKAGNWFYRLTPNTLPLDWFVGVAQFKSGDSVSAGASFQKALKVTPYEVRVLNDHAISLYKLGRPADAKSELKKTIALDPFFDDARFNLAAILYFNGQPDSARILVQRCRESQKKTDFLSELK